MNASVTVVGGGLAGSEAAWQLARRGVDVELIEMRPVRTTPAHTTDRLAELVCSNSLRGNAPDQAAGLLKEEMRRLGSLILRVADEVRVPAGSALAVDRQLFAERVTHALSTSSHVRIERREIEHLPDAPVAIVATGPLTSPALADEIAAFLGTEHLHFYDAISPIVEAESIDLTRAFRGSRYGKGGADYLNCALTPDEYRLFFEALVTAERATPHAFERETFFEGCLPVEVIAGRGPETLLFGPLKPVGLVDPRTGQRPFAVVQLRQDNLAASHYSLVGFQTHLKWGEQQRVFRLIPGLEHAEFVRFGTIHRNTYINAPAVLEPTFETRRRPGLFFAGQVSGVEGYVESAASGLVAGICAAHCALGLARPEFPSQSALGSLGRYVARSEARDYQPTNFAFGLLPELSPPVRNRVRRRTLLAQRALESIDRFAAEHSPAGDGRVAATQPDLATAIRE